MKANRRMFVVIIILTTLFVWRFGAYYGEVNPEPVYAAIDGEVKSLFLSTNSNDLLVSNDFLANQRIEVVKHNALSSENLLTLIRPFDVVYIHPDVFTILDDTIVREIYAQEKVLVVFNTKLSAIFEVLKSASNDGNNNSSYPNDLREQYYARDKYLAVSLVHRYERAGEVSEWVYTDYRMKGYTEPFVETLLTIIEKNVMSYEQHYRSQKQTYDELKLSSPSSTSVTFPAEGATTVGFLNISHSGGGNNAVGHSDGFTSHVNTANRITYQTNSWTNCDYVHQLSYKVRTLDNTTVVTDNNSIPIIWSNSTHHCNVANYWVVSSHGVKPTVSSYWWYRSLTLYWK